MGVARPEGQYGHRCIQFLKGHVGDLRETFDLAGLFILGSDPGGLLLLD
jgi:hypothetical protein